MTIEKISEYDAAKWGFGFVISDELIGILFYKWHLCFWSAS